MKDKVKQDTTKQKKGKCDICGKHSENLLDGVCEKPVCQRYIEEGKHCLT